MNRTVLLVAVLTVVGVSAALLLLTDDSHSSSAAPVGPTTAATDLDGERPEPRPGIEGLAPTSTSPASSEPLESSGVLAAILRGRVVDRGGHARSDATVVLWRGGLGGFEHMFGPTALSTQTDGEGRFSLIGVPTNVPIAVEASTSDRAPKRVTVRPLKGGDTRSLGDIVLERGTTLTGLVSDTAGVPLAGAAVVVHDTLAGGALVGQGSTGEDGRYAIEHLAPRQYAMTASADGHATMETVQAFVLGAPGPTWTVDFALAPASERLELTTIDPFDVVVPDVTVRLLQRDPNSPAHFTAEQTSDAAGRLVFEALPAGQFDVTVRSDAWYLTSSVIVRTDSGEHTVRVHPALAIHGLLDPAVDQFSVTIRPDGRSGARVLGGAGLTRQVDGPDPSGTFSWEGLTPGAYHFEVRAPGFALSRSQKLVLGRGIDELDVTIVLLAGGRLVGRIDPNRAGVVVQLRDASWDPASSLEHTFPTPPVFGLSTTTSDDGRFEIDHVPSGRYVVTARLAGMPAVHVKDVAVSDGGTSDVGLLTLRSGGTLTGHVFGPDGLPRAGATVRLASEQHHQTAVTDADGSFVMDAIPAGEYHASAAPGTLAEALRYVAASDVHVRAETTTQLELRLSERER